MRKINGDLGLVGIANLLQFLHSNQVQGTLTISAGADTKVIRFAPDGIRLIRGVRRTNPLGEILVRTRKITQQQLDDILIQQRISRKRLGDLLAEKGIVSRESLEAALREQVAEEIYDLFSWTEAEFEFVEAVEFTPLDPNNPLSAIVLDANVVSIMIEAARRVDELARIQEYIPDFKLVPVQVEIPLALDDPGLDRLAVDDILPLVDGERTVEEVIESSLYPRFTVLRTVYGLAQRGILKIRQSREGEKPVTVVYRKPGARADHGEAAPNTVLIVSPLVTFRNALAFAIRNAGYDVREVDRWDSAAQTLCQNCVNVILLDVPLESEDGVSLCRQLREATRIPFILLSGNRGREAAANAVGSGARFVLVKPINESALIERIDVILNRQPQSPPPAESSALGVLPDA
jgi:CheY-like chemotaxis protein